MEREAVASRKADSLSDNNAALLRSNGVVLEANTALEAANRALVDANLVLRVFCITLKPRVELCTRL